MVGSKESRPGQKEHKHMEMIAWAKEWDAYHIKTMGIILEVPENVHYKRQLGSILDFV